MDEQAIKEVVIDHILDSANNPDNLALIGDLNEAAGGEASMEDIEKAFSLRGQAVVEVSF